MSSSSQNPERDPSRREELLFILRHGGATSDLVANQVVDNFAAELIAEAIEAARDEYLADATGDETDEAYNNGVADAIAAIGKLPAAVKS